MNRRLALAITALALLAGPTQLAAHDDKIHKATIGEVAAANANGLDLKTSDGIVKGQALEHGDVAADGRFGGVVEVHC